MDVSFDILLDIFANQSIDRPLGVTDICAGSRMPQTSVRRWIQKLEHIAIVKRQGDPDDHRRDLMSLAPLIFATLAKMLAAPST